MESLKGVSRGRLSIAVATTVKYLAPKLLAAFHHRYPGIALALDVTNREQLLRLLEANAVDLVLMGQPPDGVEVASEAFMENPLVVVAPSDHPLAGETLHFDVKIVGLRAATPQELEHGHVHGPHGHAHD